MPEIDIIAEALKSFIAKGVTSYFEKEVTFEILEKEIRNDLLSVWKDKKFTSRVKNALVTDAVPDGINIRFKSKSGTEQSQTALENLFVEILEANINKYKQILIQQLFTK